MNDGNLLIPQYSARDLLAANVSELMRAHPEMGSPRLLAAKCRWPATAGPKRRGKKLSERYIRYVLNPTAEDGHSPSLDVINAIAAAFETQAWRLLVDDKTLRVWMVGKLFTSSEAVSNAKVEEHYPLPPTPATATPKRAAERHRKKRPPPSQDEDHE